MESEYGLMQLTPGDKDRLTDIEEALTRIEDKLDKVLSHAEQSSALEDEMRPLLDMAQKSPLMRMMKNRGKLGT